MLTADVSLTLVALRIGHIHRKTGIHCSLVAHMRSQGKECERTRYFSKLDCLLSLILRIPSPQSTRYMMFLTLLTSSLFLSFVLGGNVSETLPCNADAIPQPEYFGTSVTNLQANEVRGWSVDTAARDSNGRTPARGWNGYTPLGLLETTPPKEAIDFCNITVTYTHPGLNDEVNVYVWLPLQSWNERFIGVGGLGFAARTEGRASVTLNQTKKS